MDIYHNNVLDGEKLQVFTDYIIFNLQENNYRTVK